MRVAALAVVLTVLLAGCGNSGGSSISTEDESTSAQTTTAELTPVPEPRTGKSVRECLRAGGATVYSSRKLVPGGVEEGYGVFAEGPVSGRIGIVLTQSPLVARKVSRMLAAESDYSINLANNRRIIVLFDDAVTEADKALATVCSSE